MQQCLTQACYLLCLSWCALGRVSHPPKTPPLLGERRDRASTTTGVSIKLLSGWWLQKGRQPRRAEVAWGSHINLCVSYLESYPSLLGALTSSFYFLFLNYFAWSPTCLENWDFKLCVLNCRSLRGRHSSWSLTHCHYYFSKILALRQSSL